MFEELKEILIMVANAGEFTLQAALSLVIAFGVYKLLTLASILVLIKFTIDKLHNYFITKKVNPPEPVVKEKWNLRNSQCYIADEVLFKKLMLISRDLHNVKTTGQISTDKVYDEDLYYTHFIKAAIDAVQKSMNEEIKKAEKRDAK